MSDDDVTAQHDAMERSFRGIYDTTIFNTTLNAQGAGGRVSVPGNKVLMPFDAAVMCEKWIDQRQRLASRNPAADSGRSGVRGTRPAHSPSRASIPKASCW